MAGMYKRWITLGFGSALMGSALVACEKGGEGGGEGEERGTASTIAGEGEGEGERAASSGHGEMGEGEGEGEGGATTADEAALPLPKRLAFMTGHVEAGLALYRAGYPQMAAPHLLHPVSETHAAEREGLDTLGFDAEVFKDVSRALEEGRPASEIEPQLAQAEANLAAMAGEAGGDPADIIQFLMDTIVVEYGVAITEGKVSDPGEYQDAFGFAVVARDRAEGLHPSLQASVRDEIDQLLALWPADAPVPPTEPAPVAQVLAQTSRVVLALSR